MPYWHLWPDNLSLNQNIYIVKAIHNIYKYPILIFTVLHSFYDAKFLTLSHCVLIKHGWLSDLNPASSQMTEAYSISVKTLPINCIGILICSLSCHYKPRFPEPKAEPSAQYTTPHKNLTTNIPLSCIKTFFIHYIKHSRRFLRIS